MANISKRHTKPQIILIVSIIAILALASWPIAEYHKYAYALAWHWVHGDYAKVAGHKVRIPALWWEEADPNSYDTYLIVRSSPASAILTPEIVVRPTISGEVGEDDSQELKTEERVIALKSKDTIVKTQITLVILKPRPFTLYCEQDDAILFGVALFSNLSCHAARTHYSFTYNGNPAFEKEAEMILSTLE